MKSFLLLAALWSTMAFGASEIVLNPGSSVTVNAGESLNIRCSGSSSGTKDCTVTVKWERDKFDRVCSCTFCAVFYEFGFESSWKCADNVSEAAGFCRQNMNSNP